MCPSSKYNKQSNHDISASKYWEVVWLSMWACSYTNVLQHSNPALPRTLNQDLGMNWVNGQNLITLGEKWWQNAEKIKLLSGGGGPIGPNVVSQSVSP